MDSSRARALFPRGLVQPEGGTRFSLDALLLACFARPKRNARAVDLGAGCGAAGLGLLLANPDAGMSVTGLEIFPEMADAANVNAARLGLSDACQAMTGDLREIRNIEAFAPAGFDLVLANPPYRRPGSGRTSPKGEMVNAARFALVAGEDAFLAAAAYLLRNKGSLAVSALAEGLAGTLAALTSAGLTPKRLRLVHGRVFSPAKIALIEARKLTGPGLAVEPPLILYEKGQGNRVTPEALAFCPFLAANAG